jgi:YaiO family outer membrane protein
MRLLLASALVCISLSGTAPGQSASSPPDNELLLFFQNSSFTDPTRTDHRTFELDYYYRADSKLKLFGSATFARKFDSDDRGAGLGAYFIPDRQNSFYGYLALGFSPRVIPKADLTVEYTRLLGERFAGIIGYRVVSFTSENVQMLIPGLTFYEIQRWTFTPKVFISRLSSDSRVQATAFLHVTCELSESAMPELYYSVGSEAYRAGSVDYISSQHAWGVTVGGKIKLSGAFVLRLHYQHVVRAGFFEENGVDATLSFLW